MAKDVGYKLPENFLEESFGEEEFARVMQEFDEAGIISYDYGEIEYTTQLVKELADMIPERFEYDEQIYHTVWQLETECGGPNVRINFMSMDRGKLDIPHYNPLTNTIYINEPLTLFPDVIQPAKLDLLGFTGEYAHAKQFHERPVETYLQGAESYIRIGKKILTEGKSVTAAQLEEYHIPGSLEYIAHKEIEPEILERIQSDTKEND